MNTRIALSIGLVAVTLLAGCSGQSSDLDQWIASVKEKPGKDLPPLPAAPEYDRFTYQAHGLRDPFSAFVVDPNANPSALRPDSQRIREPLEEFPLDGLRMVGSIGSGPGRHALVMDPSGITHRIGVGRYLGMSDGRVIRVSPDKIDIVELVSNGRGGWEEASTALVLSTP